MREKHGSGAAWDPAAPPARCWRSPAELAPRKAHPMRASRIVLPLLLLVAAALPTRADEPLYIQLGGREGIARIVDTLVALYRTDPRIKADLGDAGPDGLAPRLTDYLCQLADGPCRYEGHPTAASHKELTRAQFTAVAEDLQTAMGQAGVPYRAQNRLLARLAPTQRDIIAP